MIKHLLKPLIAAAALSCSLCASAGSYDDYFRAVKTDDASMVVRLVNAGFDPNARDEQGQVGLFLSLREGSFKVADALLRAPQLQVDAANESGETPLMMAALRGEKAWVQRLIDRGARINSPGWTPLHYAASGPSTEVLVLLLDRGAAIDARSPNGSTALMMSSRYGPEDSTLRLLERGANPRLRNQRDLNAADFARLGGREPLATRLDNAAR